MYYFLNKCCRLQVKDAQCFPVEEGPGEMVLVWPSGDGVTCQPLFDSKSCSKNLDKILGVVQYANLPLDIGAVFFSWVSKDRQLTNSAVLRGQLHFFFHQVFETDGS